MLKGNSELMFEAREALRGNWPMSIGAGMLYSASLGVIQIFFLTFLSIIMIPIGILFDEYTLGFDIIYYIMNLVAIGIFSGPFYFGVLSYFLNLSRFQEVNITDFFIGLKHISISIKTYLMMISYILLWSLLFIIPGIIVSISYSMTFFILIDDNTLTPEEALNRSKALMNGNKMKFLFLNLRFSGWILLSVITLGLAVLWLIPYMYASHAMFYNDLKANYLAEENY